MHRFFLSDADEILLQGEFSGSINIKDRDNLRHIAATRIKIGESAEFMNEDSIYTSVCRDFQRNKYCEFSIADSRKCIKPQPVLDLFQMNPRGKKLDLIVQKSVELGASSITIFQSEFSNRNRLPKIDRLNKIALEAVLQSKREQIVPVLIGGDFADMTAKFPEYDCVFFFYEHGGERLLDITRRLQISQNSKIAVVIGSEGGFSQSETEIAKRSGAVITSLGNRVLRAETAPLAAISILMHLLESGDI